MQLQKRMTCACAVFNALLCFAEFCTTYILHSCYMTLSNFQRFRRRRRRRAQPRRAFRFSFSYLELRSVLCCLVRIQPFAKEQKGKAGRARAALRALVRASAPVRVRARACAGEFAWCEFTEKQQLQGQGAMHPDCAHFGAQWCDLAWFSMQFLLRSTASPPFYWPPLLPTVRAT